MATDGFEQSELEVPLERLQDAGADIDISSIEMGDITGWDEDDWGDEIEVDLKISDVDIANYDALILPGGPINPDLLRVNADAIYLIRDFAATGKPVRSDERSVGKECVMTGRSQWAPDNLKKK